MGDLEDRATLARAYLELRRCKKCKRMRVKGYICHFCGDDIAG